MAKYTALTANSSITYIVYMYSVQFSYSKANLNSTVTSISSDHDFQYPLVFFLYNFSYNSFLLQLVCIVCSPLDNTKQIYIHNPP